MDLSKYLATFNNTTELKIRVIRIIRAKKIATFAPMNIKEIENKRIAVLLSGGVDSSVVVYEFARMGLHPDCFYIKIGPEEQEEWDCSSEEDLEMATAVSHKYGCKLEVIDCHKEYWDQVTKYTMDKVKAGLTPNPDVTVSYTHLTLPTILLV